MSRGVGAPRKITDRQIEKVITKTLESMPANGTHWSTRLMAAETGLTQNAIVRIWHAFGLRNPGVTQFLGILESVDRLGHPLSLQRNFTFEQPRIGLHLILQHRVELRRQLPSLGILARLHQNPAGHVKDGFHRGEL